MIAAGEAGQGPSHDLPVPYESPWGLLKRDLIAVWASLCLRIQELWRRNREGDLSVPSFWPEALAALFWPMLLALGLAIAVALPLELIQAALGALPRPQSSPAPAAGQLVAPAGEAPVVPPSRALPQAERAEPQEAAAPDQPAAPLQPLLQLDPLLELLADDDPEHLIRSAHPNPAQARLDLQLDEAFAALPDSRQRQLAQHWLDRSEVLGYEELHLLDGRGDLLGRRARVGSGMILFSVHPEF